MPRYRVVVADNFHYQDPDEHREHGTYETAAEALAACRAVVDQSLAEEHRAGISADDLYQRYVSFGDDPFIVALDEGAPPPPFSAFTYARERCRILCGPDGKP